MGETLTVSAASLDNELTCKYFVTCISSLTVCLICQEHIAELKKNKTCF